jgi:hypothetical protein
MKMMILALKPHMHQEEILLRDMKEHQLQAFVAVGKKKCPQKPCRGCAANKNMKTPDVSATHSKSPCMKEIASRGMTPERNTPLVSLHFKFHYDICSRLVITAVYMDIFIFNDTSKIIQ